MTIDLYDSVWGKQPGPHSMKLTADNLEDVAAWVGDGATAVPGEGIRWRYIGAPFLTRYDTLIPIGWVMFRRVDGGHYARKEDGSV